MVFGSPKMAEFTRGAAPIHMTPLAKEVRLLLLERRDGSFGALFQTLCGCV